MASNLYARILDTANQLEQDSTGRLRALLPYTNNPNTRTSLSSIYDPNTISDYANSFTGSAYSYLFFMSLLAFVLFLLLVVIHFTITPVFSFAANQPGFLSIPTVSDVEKAYTDGPAVDDVPAALTSMCTNNYTVAFDVYLTGDFNIAGGARVLLYKRNTPSSPSPILSSSVTTAEPSKAVFTDTDIIVWLDKIKNDMYVGTFTSESELEKTTPIENLPIRKPFRIAIVFSDNFIEVYKDGKIEKTITLKSPPISLTGNPPFYPPIKTVPTGAMIGNLSFWPRILSAKEVRANGTPVGSNLFFSPTKSGYKLW